MSVCPFCKEKFGAPPKSEKELTRRNVHLKECSDKEVDKIVQQRKIAIQFQIDLLLKYERER